MILFCVRVRVRVYDATNQIDFDKVQLCSFCALEIFFYFVSLMYLLIEWLVKTNLLLLCTFSSHVP